MPIDCEQLPAGTILGGYRIESELGRGNNAIVYQAVQESLGRRVALKILLAELVREPGYVTSFLREARLAARLDHPYIVQAYDTGETPEGFYYFAMELVWGPSLEVVRSESPEQLTFELIFRLSVELAEALDYAWTSHNMTHGDIKPGNLLISSETGELKLADLGLARVSGTQQTEDIMATPLYAAPEVIEGQTGGVRSDLYSFGIMLYELLCGAPPFVGNPQSVLQQHLYNEPQPLLERNPDLDPELAAFVELLIQKAPEKRPASWQEVRSFFLDRLERLHGEPPAGSYQTIEREHRKRQRRKSGVIFVVILLLLAVLTAAALFAIRISSFTPAPLAPSASPVPAADQAPHAPTVAPAKH